MRRRSLLLLATAAAAVLGSALLLTSPPDTPAPPESGSLLFPGLASRLQQANRIEIRRHAESLIIERRGELWGLPSHGGYPVRQERVRELLTGLTELRLLEPRTADPAMLPRLGLDHPPQAGSSATLVQVFDSQGGTIAELVVGRRRLRTQGNVPENVLIRRPAETQAWLAEGRLPVDTDPQLWLDRDIAHLPRERIRRIVIDRHGGPRLVIGRGGDPEGRLFLAEPADSAPLEETALEEVARALEFLTFLEVRPREAMPGTPLGEARFEMTDNLAVVVRTHKADDALWITLSAEGDDEAARLNARWRSWSYQIGAWKEKAFAPQLADLQRSAETTAAREREGSAPLSAENDERSRTAP